MSTRKDAIKAVLSERNEDDINNEMIQADVIMDAEVVSNESYDITETAIIDVKEVHREIESERTRTDAPTTTSGG